MFTIPFSHISFLYLVFYKQPLIPNSLPAQNQGALVLRQSQSPCLHTAVSGNSFSWEPFQLWGFPLKLEDIHWGDLQMPGAAQLLLDLKKILQHNLPTER